MTVIPAGDEGRSPLPGDTVSLLTATLDATADGILVVDRAGKIVLFNTRFVQMWGISDEVLATRDDDKALAEAVSRVRDPDAFVARIAELYEHPGEESFDIVRTIIDLARDLSMRVVAEGIETEAQAAALRAMRCDAGQGYLFARPQPVEEATRLLLKPTW